MGKASDDVRCILWHSGTREKSETLPGSICGKQLLDIVRGHLTRVKLQKAWTRTEARSGEREREREIEREKE